MDYFSSPINYQGNKKQYLNVVYKSFGCSRDVRTICDVFAGSFTVGANMLTVYQDSIIECNDLRKPLILLYDMLAHTEYSQVEDYVKNISTRYQLLNKNSKMKEGYEALAVFYNQNPQANILALIPLTMCCFNGDASFDNMIFKGRFGERCVTSYQMEKLKIFHSVLYENKQRIKFSSLSFDAIDYSQYTPKDILYFDPPYFLSSVLYGSGWNRDMEAKLYNIIIDLHNRHIPFALSNLLEYKGRKNYLLEQLLKIKGIESEDAQTDYSKLQRCSTQMKELYSHYPNKEIVAFRMQKAPILLPIGYKTRKRRSFHFNSTPYRTRSRILLFGNNLRHSWTVCSNDDWEMDVICSGNVNSILLHLALLFWRDWNLIYFSKKSN